MNPNHPSNRGLSDQRSPHRPASQISRELDTLKRTIALADPLPDLTELQLSVNTWTTKTLLDPIHKSDLWEANQALIAAQRAWAERATMNTTLRQLTNELSEALAAERWEAATRADAQLGQAISEYKAACLIAAKSLRALLRAQASTSRTPGASANLSALRLAEFNIPHLIALGQGTLGQAMLATNQPQHFEQPDLRLRVVDPTDNPDQSNYASERSAA